MASIFYYIAIYLVIGAIGMSIANTKVAPPVRKKRWLKYFTYILITGLVIASIFLNFFVWLSCLIVAVGVVELSRADRNGRPGLIIRSFLVYAVIACGFLFFSSYFRLQSVLFIYFQVLIFDAFGQITGQLFGKKLLAPRVSPTKTVEGLIGGWLFCIVSALLGATWVNLSIGLGVLFGLFTGLTSFCGDLLASWFKRLRGIKDYSNWLPGQGGFLDRFDSFLFTGAAYYVADLLIKNLLPVKN